MKLLRNWWFENVQKIFAYWAKKITLRLSSNSRNGLYVARGTFSAKKRFLLQKVCTFSLQFTEGNSLILLCNFLTPVQQLRLWHFLLLFWNNYRTTLLCITFSYWLILTIEAIKTSPQVSIYHQITIHNVCIVVCGIDFLFARHQLS